MKPIAMKCTQEQWEDIKPLLTRDNILIRLISKFNDSTYLTNCFAGVISNISNIYIEDIDNYGRKVYTEWDKNIFLEACDIKIISEFIIDKWYKYNNIDNENYYIKCKGHNKNNSKVVGETIIDGLYLEYDYWSSDTCIKKALDNGPLTDLTEIQEYLPDYHIDKFKSEFTLPEKWCILRTEENAKVINSFFNRSENNKENFSYYSSTDYLTSDYINTKFWITPSSYKPDKYTEITLEQFKKYILKQNSMNTTDINKTFPFHLDPHNAQRIIDIACSTWKSKLASMWAHNMVLGKPVEISESFYKEMRSACTNDQHKLFDSIFGKDIEKCPYKVGDWIVVNNIVVKITEIREDHDHTYWICYTSNTNTGGRISFKAYKDSIRLATSEEIAKSNCPYKDGELIWVKMFGVWELRYSNGKINSSGGVEVYCNQFKNGSILTFLLHKKAEGITLPE